MESERAPVAVKNTVLPTKGLLVPATMMKAVASIVTVSPPAAISVFLGVSVSKGVATVTVPEEALMLVPRVAQVTEYVLDPAAVVLNEKVAVLSLMAAVPSTFVPSRNVQVPVAAPKPRVAVSVIGSPT
jgi:hypothetical protein